MKSKQKKELASKTIDELQNLLKETQEGLMKMRHEKSQFKLKNTRSIFNSRKQLAMILTFMKQKEHNHE